MSELAQDVRYGLRRLRLSPGFTLAVVLVLGLGIGATTAIFSVLDAALLQPLPYREPARLVAVADLQGHCHVPMQFVRVVFGRHEPIAALFRQVGKPLAPTLPVWDSG